MSGFNWQDYYPAVRCRDCVHCPSKPGKRCEPGQRRPQKLKMPRRCTAYEPPAPSLSVVPPPPRRPVPPGKSFDVFCGDAWIVHDSGAEPAYCCDEAEVIPLFLAWLRQRREREVARLEADRRRAAMRGVTS